MRDEVVHAKCKAACGVRDGESTLRAMLREPILAAERFLGKITGASVGAIRGYLDEPIHWPAFARHLRDAEQKFSELAITSADLYATH